MILFLDIDGTLHPLNRRDGTLSCLPRLEGVLRNHPTVQIVISSAWRTDHTVDALRALFSPDISERVVGATPERRTTHGIEPHQRELEIHDWLMEEGREHEQWVCLDDDEWQFTEGGSRLILVDGDTGMTDVDARELSARLSRFGG
jgi:hypothetical protein